MINDEVKQETTTNEYFKKYASIIGCLLWISRTTRPDIAPSVGFLTRFQSKPNKRHWKAAINVLKYLKCTKTISLTYSKDLSLYKNDFMFIEYASNPKILNIYCDASYANDLDDRKSTTGFLIYYLGCLILWGSKKQSHVAKSTMQAEYHALGYTTDEIRKVRGILNSIGFSQETSIVHEDSTSAIFSAENKVLNSTTRAFEIQYHSIREAISNKEIKLVLTATKQMIADFMTKILETSLFRQLRAKVLNLKGAK